MLEQEEASESSGLTSEFIDEETKASWSEQVRSKDPGT